VNLEINRWLPLAAVIVAAAAAVSPIALEAEGAPTTSGEPRALEFRDDPPASVAASQDPKARSPGVRVSVGPYVSVQVNVDEFGQNIVGDAANEPSIAVNPIDPDNMVIGWRQFDSIASNFRQGGWGFSTDGGASWTFPGTLTPGIFRSDPVLDTDSSGNFYYQSLQESFDMDVFKSSDGGASWGPPVPSFGGDKNWMVVDKSGGIGDGHVYGIWQRFFGCCGQNTFTRSTDGAASFEFPVVVAFRPIFGTMAVGPDGEVYATGVDGTLFQDFNQYVIAKSANARNPLVTPTFTGSQVDLGGSMVLSTGPNPAGLLGQANVAVDQSDGSSAGNVYILGSVNPAGVDPLDVHMIRSTDGGITWSDPIRVNNDPPGANAWQWFGAHSVAPNGRIDVIWNDTRNSGQANISELFYAYSYDQGETWFGNVPVSPPFNSFLGFPNQNKLGDYYTLISDQVGADVAYAATFNLEQDVYYLRVFPDCNDNGISDVTDISDGTSTDLNGNQNPDECELFLNGPFPGVAGRTNIFVSSDGTAGSLVVLYRGFTPGLTPIAACGGNPLGLENGIIAGFGRANANGVAVILSRVPASFQGRTVLYQTVEFPGCTFSGVVTFTYP
jgi:hypothetical protein